MTTHLPGLVQALQKSGWVRLVLLTQVYKNLNGFKKINKMNCELMLTYDTPAYMFNMYKNQVSRQTGSRNLLSSFIEM
jgi:hypothetical protein